MTKKFNLKQATLWGIAGLVTPYLLFILVSGVLMWEWNLLDIISENLFFVRFSTLLCISGFLLGGFLKNDN